MELFALFCFAVVASIGSVVYQYIKAGPKGPRPHPDYRWDRTMQHWYAPKLLSDGERRHQETLAAINNNGGLFGGISVLSVLIILWYLGYHV